MNQTLRRLIIALLLAVLVYGAFVLYVGYQRIGDALQTFAWWTMGAALALSSVNYVLRFLKWEYYLRRLGIRGIPLWDSFLIFLSGFVLTVTPGKVGEVFKSAVLKETYGIDPARTAPIIVAERLTDVIAVVVLVVLGSLGFEGGLVWAAAGGTCVLIGVGLILWDTPANAGLEFLRRSGGRKAALVPKLETALTSLRIVASPRALLLPSLLSLIGWGGEGCALYLLVHGYGEVLPVALSIFFYATSTLAGALVPVPGGLGVAEAMINSQLIEIGGISLGAATASMLMIRFATLWWAVIVGFAALFLLRLRYPGLLAKTPKG